MELTLLNLDLRKVLVDDELGDVEAFWLQAELPVYVDDPLEQECTRRVSNFGLDFGDIGGVNHEGDLLLLQTFENGLAELRNMLRVGKVLLVFIGHVLHLRLDVLGDSLAELESNGIGMTALVTLVDWQIIVGANLSHGIRNKFLGVELRLSFLNLLWRRVFRCRARLDGSLGRNGLRCLRIGRRSDRHFGLFLVL